MNCIQIAIDGPAGSGKSTVAKCIADRLKITYLDTGAMYRAVTLVALQEKVNLEDAAALKDIVDHINLKISPGIIVVNGIDGSEAIRTPEVTQNVSYVAKDAYVRAKMVELQQQIAGNQSVVMDGRDIGTHVLPNAKYKFFLVASSEERAKRRIVDLRSKGFDTTLEALIAEIDARDKIDSEREVAPLTQASDAKRIDTTFMCIDEVVDTILGEIETSEIANFEKDASKERSYE